MTEIGVSDLVARLEARVGEMIELLDTLVSSESPSNDPALLAATADLIAERASSLLGMKPERITGPGAPALRWSLPGVRCDGRPVLILAHLDTVWPAGTIARWPFSVDGNRGTGPGAFDMKAGLVQALFALAALGETDLDRPPVVVLVTADEEIGSPAGREVIESVALDASAVAVLGGSETGPLEGARQGGDNYDLYVTGRSAPPGPEAANGGEAPR